MKKYLYVTRTQIIKSFTYSFNVYGNIIMQTIIMITSAFFWKALYRNGTSMSGVDVDGMLVYTVISAALSVLFFTNVERRIEESVQKGSIATDLMKPIDIFGVYLAEDIGSVIALVFQNLIPIVLVGCVAITSPQMADSRLAPLFVLSVLASMMINWLISALFGLWSFTAINIDALIQVKKHLVRLLSGSIIPLWFFPSWLESILNLLPFKYIYQLPLSIYIGQVGIKEIMSQMRIQLVWLVILAGIFTWLRSSIIKKVMVQGG